MYMNLSLIVFNINLFNRFQFFDKLILNFVKYDLQKIRKCTMSYLNQSLAEKRKQAILDHLNDLGLYRKQYK